MRPLPPPADPDAVLEVRLTRWLRLARAAVLWERLWPLVLPPLCLIGLFLSLAMFDVLPLLPGWLHAMVLAGVSGGLGFLAIRAMLRLMPPSLDQAARRLERDSGLTHRPLAALADRPAVLDDPVAGALWQVHRRRMAAMLNRLRVALPHPNMAARDPWGLRAAVLLLLVIAATVSGTDAPRRLVRALTPAVDIVGLGPDGFQVWLTPPAYTGMAPVLLKPGQPSPVTVPAGSAVLAVLSGGWGTASLALNGTTTPFQRQPDGSQRLESQVQATTRLAVRQAGLTVASWSVAVTADATPSISLTMAPEAGERGRLRLAATASDDYGLVKAWVVLHRLGAPAEDEPVMVELPLPGGRPRVADIASWHDLTAHPWAGLPVSVQPVVEDAIGQRGSGEIHTITLPERNFTNPVAAALVDLRRQITEDRRNAPGAMGLLDRIAVEPGLFNDDLKTFLILRAARHAMDDPAFDLAEVQDLLWNGALRIEEGDLASAERALDQARRALEQAMDANAPAAEIQRLIEQFQQAMQRYIESLAERMAANGQPQPMPNADGRAISDEELQQMVEGMRDMAETGARDALRQMLRDLSEILDGLQAGAQQPANGSAAEGLQSLRELARRQQDMLDQTHQRAQQEGEAGGQQEGGKGQSGKGGQSGGGSGNGAQAAQAQQALQQALGEVARKLGEGLGEVPHALSEAGEAMAEAVAELSRGQWGNAAQAQAQALQLMQQAAREAREQMGNAGQGNTGLVPRDPLGRPSRGTGAGDDGTTRVPDHSDIQRSRDLLEEIRRRAGEFQRPEPERDYLHRLLKQF